MERSQMMESVLVANRGEIAVRIMRTLRALGIASIGVYSDADRDARHVVEADMAVRLGPAPAQESYLSVPAILAAVASSGAAAVHPGYGFLSENAGFARAVIDAGAVWIGPPPAAIDAMGDKIRAKATVAAAGVPVVPGRTDPGLSDDELVAAALDVGLPVLIKPSAGGGGKGMHRVESASDLRGAIAAARREAAASFGDDTLLVERWVTRPRHIEVQIFADTRSTVVHLGERECSLQRRHQKIVEEAPSPLLDEATRARLGASAVDAARACGYVGAGTVEFIVSADRPQEYFFLEMNTRLQVEHPVTEAVTGLDLVEAQLRVAAGERLAFGPEAAQARGHAMEARVYAEDPARGFLPASGTILALHEPQGPGIRVDSSLATGTTVGTAYDPMLAKVIAWGADREEARARLVRALADTRILGVTTNVGFLGDLLGHPDVVSGALDTELVERVLPALVADAAEDRDHVASAAGALWALEAEGPGRRRRGADPWDQPGAWRLTGPAPIPLRLSVSGDAVTVTVTGRAPELRIAVDAGPTVPSSVRWAGRAHRSGRFQLEMAGRTTTWGWAAEGEDRWLGRDGRSWLIRPERPGAVAAGAGPGGGGPVRSPMPGTVLSVAVTVGDRVTAGTPLVVVEAMKMEHSVTAPVDGEVTEVLVRPGQSVRLDESLAVVTPAEAGPGVDPAAETAGKTTGEA
jgi:acetyl-CoA/propionyl-CoA carboxylase biotin carboxyl carrier protein